MKKKRGIFIAIEGGDGAGKDTQIERIKSFFGASRDILSTSSLGGTSLGRAFREVILSPKHTAVTPETELLLFCAARAQLMNEIVIPALKEGQTVITNRFDGATAAYQIYGRKREHLYEVFKTINTLALTDDETGLVFAPDAYILLDVAPEIGIARKSGKTEGLDRIEAETPGFHKRVRRGFKTCLRQEHSGRHSIINANREVDAVWEDMKKHLERIFSFA